MLRRLTVVAIATLLLALALGVSHASAEGRPRGCPKLWCGCWARMQAGIQDTKFNQAKHWLVLRHVAGRGARPVVGSWAVMSRRGGGHVGKVVGIDANGNPIIKSGNHGHQVGTGVYPRQRIIAYVTTGSYLVGNLTSTPEERGAPN